MNQPLRVFICGTFRDLKEERQAVLEAIRRVKMEHDSMEYFGARPDRPLNTSLDEVRRSDILVILVAHKYGTIVMPDGRSYSELEYREGVRLGKICLPYFLAEDAKVLKANVETDPDKVRLLEAWKNELSTNHTVRPFSDPADLALSVASDLTEAAKIKNRVASTETYETRTWGGDPDLARAVEEMVRSAVMAGVARSILIDAIRSAVTTTIDAARQPLEAVTIIALRADEGIARDLAERLHRQPMNVSLALFDGHAERIGELTLSLQTTAVAVVIISPSISANDTIRSEIEAAVWRRVADRGNTQIVPVVVRGAALPAVMRTLPNIDLDACTWDEAVEKITALMIASRKSGEMWTVGLIPGAPPR